MGIALGIFSAITGFATLLGLYLALDDEFMNRKSSSTKTQFPIKIRRSVRYKTYSHTLGEVARRMKESDVQPSRLVAIQYGALVPAAELAKIFRVPVLHIEVTLNNSGEVPVCDYVTLRFDPTVIKGTHVILVDNTITTGMTLKKAKEALLAIDDVTVTTCVVYQPRLLDPNYGQSDYLLYKSRKKIDPLLR